MTTGGLGGNISKDGGDWFLFGVGLAKKMVQVREFIFCVPVMDCSFTSIEFPPPFLGGRVGSCVMKT